MKKNIKAVALVSSGLDSMLAAKIIKDQGVNVYGLSLSFKFDSIKHSKRIDQLDDLKQELGISIKLLDKTDKFLDIVKYPQHGYGSEMNPCIDCRIQMLQLAKDYMDDIGAQFIITGEVVGQRPMSQQKPTIFHIDKVTGLRGIIVRPLSAKILPETIPEQQNWIDREQLFDFRGRSRTPQLLLASKLGLTHFETPAGGCSLTTPDFSRRLFKLFENKGRENVSVRDMELLLHGRHFWPNTSLNVIVGRNEKDNDSLEELNKGAFWSFTPADVPGPYTLALYIQNSEDIKTAASLVARYTSQRKTDKIQIKYYGKESGMVTVEPADEEDVENWRI